MRGQTTRRPRRQPARRGLWVAPFWKRVVAFVVDGFVVLLLTSWIGAVAGWVDWSRVPPDPRWNLLDCIADTINDQGAGLLRMLVLGATLLGVYGVLFEGVGGATPGKRLLELRVVDRHGDRPHWLRTVLRNVFKLIGLALCGLGPLWAAFGRTRRAWHDVLTGCYLEDAARSSATRRSTS